MSQYINTELEQTILGCAMGSGRARVDMLNVRPAHFADLRHAALWTLIGQMDTNGEAIDAVTVLGALKRIPEIDRQGLDGVYLHQCVALAMNFGAAATYARQLINLAAMRRLDDALTRSRQILDGSDDAAEALEEIRTEIDSTRARSSRGRMLGEIVAEVVADLDKPSVIYETPWASLNAIIDGWRPGGLYVIGARPGVGKTIVGMQAAVTLANIGPVAFSALEMQDREVGKRALSLVSGVDGRRLNGTGPRNHGLSREEKARIGRAQEVLTPLPVSVDDSSAVSVMDVRAHARTLTRQGRVAGVVVDYLQLMAGARGDRRPRHEIVADFSRQLKILAKELDCPVIALSQLNRASETRDSGTPSLADLRESGAIEQDADAVILLHVPTETLTEGGKNVKMPVNDRLVMTVAKNRHGPQDRTTLYRDGATAQVYDLPNNQQQYDDRRSA